MQWRRLGGDGDGWGVGGGGGVGEDVVAGYEKQSTTTTNSILFASDSQRPRQKVNQYSIGK